MLIKSSSLTAQTPESPSSSYSPLQAPKTPFGPPCPYKTPLPLISCDETQISLWVETFYKFCQCWWLWWWWARKAEGFVPPIISTSPTNSAKKLLTHGTGNLGGILETEMWTQISIATHSLSNCCDSVLLCDVIALFRCARPVKWVHNVFRFWRYLSHIPSLQACSPALSFSFSFCHAFKNTMASMW